MPRRFRPPWTVEKIPGGFKVLDANGQSLAYVYGHADQRDAQIAGACRDGRSLVIRGWKPKTQRGSTHEQDRICYLGACPPCRLVA